MSPLTVVIWKFPKMGAPPKSSILGGFSIIHHPASLGYPHDYGNLYISMTPDDLCQFVFQGHDLIKTHQKAMSIGMLSVISLLTNRNFSNTALICTYFPAYLCQEIGASNMFQHCICGVAKPKTTLIIIIIVILNDNNNNNKPQIGAIVCCRNSFVSRYRFGNFLGTVF